jgi:hypothetical protein
MTAYEFVQLKKETMQIHTVNAEGDLMVSENQLVTLMENYHNYKLKAALLEKKQGTITYYSSILPNGKRESVSLEAKGWNECIDQIKQNAGIK